jgi:hypothetical protein
LNLTSEGLLLAAFLLLPGFVYYFVSRSTKTTYREPPSDARVALDSLSVTLVLVGVEVAILTLLTLFVDDVRRDVKSILRDGLNTYIDDKPLTFLYVLVSAGIANVIFMAVAGWFDCIESAIVSVQRGRREAPWNVWYQILRVGPDPGQKRKEPLKVRIRLKDGGLYDGVLAAYPLTFSEGRDIALWDVSFSASENPGELRPVSADRPTGLIVLTEQIKGIEVIYPPLHKSGD